jgi:flagellar protein FlgJ
VKGFANGMQRAGYATDPHYAKKLMSIMQKMG